MDVSIKSLFRVAGCIAPQDLGSDAVHVFSTLECGGYFFDGVGYGPAHLFGEFGGEGILSFREDSKGFCYDFLSAFEGRVGLVVGFVCFLGGRAEAQDLFGWEAMASQNWFVGRRRDGGNYFGDHCNQKLFGFVGRTGSKGVE